jgi:hypothetical protein
MLHLAACALGIFMGLHFNVRALIPVTFIGVALLGTFAASSGQSLSDGLVITAANVLLCQAGYMLGLTARAAVAQGLGRLTYDRSKPI